jgi:hypothetical protein
VPADTYGTIRCVPGPGAIPCACETGHGGPCHLIISPIPIPIPGPGPGPLPIIGVLPFIWPWVLGSVTDLGGTGVRG